MKKKILFLGRFAPPAHGAARMNELYFNALKNKFNIKKIKINYSKRLEEIGRFNLQKFFGIFIVWFKLLYMLIIFRPKKVYFEIAPCGFAFFRDSLYVWLCKIFRKNIVFHLHAKGIDSQVKNKWKLRYYKKVFKDTKVIILSDILYEDIEKVVLRNNVYVIPNGVPDELSEEEFEKIIMKRKKNKKPILLFLSNMVESKGPLDVLKICDLLNKDKIDFECWFVGVWSSKEFKKKWYGLLKKYELQNKCQYLGSKYGNEKKKILKRTNFLLFPTEYPLECYPLVILEAFMFGIPVFTYDNGAIKSIIKNKTLGFVSKKKSWEELYWYLRGNLKKQVNAEKVRKCFKRNYVFRIVEKRLMKILWGNVK